MGSVGSLVSPGSSMSDEPKDLDELTHDELASLVRGAFFDAIEGHGDAYTVSSSDETVVIGKHASAIIYTAVAGAVKSLVGNKILLSRPLREAVERLREMAQVSEELWRDLGELEQLFPEPGQAYTPSSEAPKPPAEPSLVKVVLDLSRPRFVMTEGSGILTEPGVKKHDPTTNPAPVLTSAPPLKKFADASAHPISAYVPPVTAAKAAPLVDLPLAPTAPLTPMPEIKANDKIPLVDRVKAAGFNPEANLGRIFGHFLTHVGAVVDVKDLCQYIQTRPGSSSREANVSSNVSHLKRLGYRISGNHGRWRLESETPDPALKGV